MSVAIAFQTICREDRRFGRTRESAFKLRSRAEWTTPRSRRIGCGLGWTRMDSISSVKLRWFGCGTSITPGSPYTTEQDTDDCAGRRRVFCRGLAWAASAAPSGISA